MNHLQPDDPRLSAWVLGELPPDEADDVARAVECDPELQTQVEELLGMSEFLSSTLAVSGLRPDQREAVRRAGRTPTRNVIEFPRPQLQKRRLPWPLILGVAATVTVAAILTFSPGPPPRGVPDQSSLGGNDEQTAPPYTGPRISTGPSNGQSRPQRDAAPLPDFNHTARDLAANSLPEASPLPSPSPLPQMSGAAELDLPVLVGRDSYDWVRGWIRQKGQLPPKDAVRIEELANAFPLPTEEETREVSGLKVACVSMASMWSGPGRLVGVQIANESGQSRTVEWSFSPAPSAREGGVRVLASTSGSGAKAATLPPGRRTLVLIELASATDEAGDLVVESAGRRKRFPAIETKDPALRQAGLVAAFGIWLRGEGIDDSRLTQILAAAEKDTAPQWADSRKLVREALLIAEKKRK